MGPLVRHSQKYSRLKKFISLIYLLPILLGSNLLLMSVLTACMAEDDYTVEPSEILSFSTDTIAFDTIISGQPTNTYTFQVYNKNKKAIRIPRVYLEGGASSYFKVNVDGTYLEGGSASDFEIAAKDSLRVFLFVNAEETNHDFPVFVQDKLVFLLESGVQQSMPLEAYSQDVISFRSKRIETDTILDGNRPFQIFDSLVVEQGATLTVNAGVRLYFHPQANLVVHGQLIVNGTQGSPVIMRGDRLGNMFSEQPYDRIPGQWGGVIFKNSSYGNHLNFCDIHSGSFGIVCDSSGVNVEKLKVENSVIHNTSGDGLNIKMSKVFFGNSQLTNSGGNCVTLRGGHSTFVHCTIGNFYVFTGGRGVALDFSNEENGMRMPLYQAEFINSIITGYSSDEIMGKQSERYTEDAFNYRFINCLLNTPPYEDENLVNCLWEEDVKETAREKNFIPEFDLDKLIFSFSLSPASQAVNRGDADYTQIYYPNDRNGISRLSDEGPDMGCYEVLAPQE